MLALISLLVVHSCRCSVVCGRAELGWCCSLSTSVGLECMCRL